jgi:hypothetical protein
VVADALPTNGPGEDDMSAPSEKSKPDTDPEGDAERRRIAEVQDELDARADGDGLAAEAGAGEEMGLAEG